MSEFFKQEYNRTGLSFKRAKSLLPYLQLASAELCWYHSTIIIVFYKGSSKAKFWRIGEDFKWLPFSLSKKRKHVGVA